MYDAALAFLAPLFQSAVFVQALGFLGLGLFAFSFQVLSPRKTILVQSPANVLIGLHFLGLGVPFLAFIAFIASGRDLCFAFCSERSKSYFLAGYFVVLYGGAWFLVGGVFDVCGLIGSTLISAAQFFRHRFYVYRFLSMGHQGFWLIAYFMVFSISGILFMSAILLSNIVGLARYRFGRAQNS